MSRRMMVFFVGLFMVLGIGFVSTTAQAQTNQTWTAQYFNNTNFSGSPVATASLNGLNVNWGRNAPATGVNVDDWTARFNTITYFNSGTYRFTVNADDAFRLYVHGQLLIDTFSNPRPNTTFTADMTIAAGNGGIQIDYREYIGDAFLYISWQQIGGVINPPTAQPQPVGTWTAQYFNNTSLSGSPVTTLGLDNLNVNWGRNAPANGMPADNWTARFTANIYFNAGTYRFSVNADDAFRMYINSRQVYETFSNPRADVLLTYDVYLPAGNAFIQVDYREYIGPAFLYVSWSQVSQNPPTPQPNVPIGQAQLTINTGNLNLRSTPFVGDNIITQLPRGTTYAIVGRTTGSDWYQVRAGQNVGWVSARYVIASNTQNVPVVNTQVSAPNVPNNPTAYALRANANVNIRSGAVLSSSRLGILPNNTTANIVARNSSNTWWLINYGGVTGWVNGSYVVIPANIDYAQVPVR